MQAHVCYIYIRGEYFVDGQKLQAAIDEAYEKKLLGKNAAGTATAEYFVDASFGGARVVTMPTDDTTFKIIKAYTYDKGVSIFLENIGTFTRITP